MGIVFETKVGKSYKKGRSCQEAISHQLPLEKVTRQNLQFLTNLGLQVAGDKKGKRGKRKTSPKTSKSSK